ncbi:hypothetical protein UNSWDHB_576 [Dehalobacter sp. UNSWDHB]|uniref:hypothetical protein n=1 Tax=Dehalobacter TaxID=56112 RepID=UPI00028B45A9|nr:MULTISPECIES: hypothetical protein [unclassified Dehalobacter]AFV02280.1 hypothetical protein DHBDCA_p1251 [Dehalobacter sp. DCA]AFV05323.1 hypothetical protein DCF50_p1317 [Dehalobacter sp. CF]EQB22129.1 hypothetical protein UNSWDHB_576 [Dehalobacter sp. UNSWDHB]
MGFFLIDPHPKVMVRPGVMVCGVNLDDYIALARNLEQQPDSLIQKAFKAK